MAIMHCHLASAAHTHYGQWGSQVISIFSRLYCKQISIPSLVSRYFTSESDSHGMSTRMTNCIVHFYDSFVKLSSLQAEEELFPRDAIFRALQLQPIVFTHGAQSDQICCGAQLWRSALSHPEDDRQIALGQRSGLSEAQVSVSACPWSLPLPWNGSSAGQTGKSFCRRSSCKS